MGVVNVTPDSFSDGGLFTACDEAVDHGCRLAGEGAHLLDVGGESTRPGAVPVPLEEELSRVVPVIEELRRRLGGIPISVDTRRAAVAAASLDAGADLVNDISGGADPDMLAAVASRGAAIVLMHMRGEPSTMQEDTAYADVVAEVHGYLRDRAAAAMAAGLPRDRVWLDPGVGFGKDVAGNLALLAAVPDLAALGHPVVVGASRKSFIGRLTGAVVHDRLPGSLAALLPTLGLPRLAVRVHDVAATHQFLSIAAAVRSAA